MMQREKSRLSVLAATLVAGIAQSGVIVLDDEDPGYSTTGAWTREETVLTLNGDEWYQSSPNNGATATWAFNNLAAGKYYVSASWFATGNRTTAARYALDGTPAAVLDQAATQSFGFDEEVFSTGYARLSYFNGYVAHSISSGSLQVTASSAVEGRFLMADSVRLERAPQDVEKVHVVDNEDATGYTETGAWATWAGDPYDHRDNIRFTSDPTATATFSFTGLDDGVYRVSATWTAGVTRPSGVTYLLPEIGSQTVNQQGAPSDDMFEEVPWKHLFYGVTITNGTLSVVVTNSVGWGTMIADAVRLEKLDMAYRSNFVLVDDFEAHTFGFDISSNGNWRAHNYGGTVPNGTIVSNGTGQAAQLLGSGNAGYNINLGINTIPDGAIGTLFFRTRSYSANWFQLVAYLTDLNWPYDWWWLDHAGFYARWNVGDGTAMRPHYDSGNIQELAGATWYNVWLVVDNAADTFDLYISQGQDPATGFKTSTLVQHAVPYRSAAGNMAYFFIAGPEDNWGEGGLIDDLYVAQGENLKLPAPLGPPIYPKGTIIMIY